MQINFSYFMSQKRVALNVQIDWPWIDKLNIWENKVWKQNYRDNEEVEFWKVESAEAAL